MKEEDGEEGSEGGYGGEWVAAMLMHTYECLRYERRARGGDDDDDSPRRKGGKGGEAGDFRFAPPASSIHRSAHAQQIVQNKQWLQHE